MPRYFTHYWVNKTWNWQKENGYDNELLEHTAGNLFRKRNVSIGDVIYVVTVIKGSLYVCGKLKVGKICDVSEAARILGSDADELWDADEHVIASEATSMNFNIEIPLETTKNLKFNSIDGLKNLTFAAPDHLDQQTLRGVRELSEAAALELDKFLPQLQEVSDFRHKPNQNIPLAEPTFPDEVVGIQFYSEGAIKQVKVNAFERNAEARKSCIEHYKTILGGIICSVCNFDFEKIYGSIGEGYIHVHHVIPLSEIGHEYKINPIEDLRPVCPNCHAMLHKQQSPTYTIEELKQIIKDLKQQRDQNS